MNELQNLDNDIEIAVEITKQHYFVIHSDIRQELLDATASCEMLRHVINMRNTAEYVVTDSVPEKRAPASRTVKEIYKRICNLCHPDKTGSHDSRLIEFMHSAKEAMRNNDQTLIENLYSQVKMYKAEPQNFMMLDRMGRAMLERDRNPWYTVHEHHVRGDTHSAFFESRRILGELLAQRRLEEHNLTEHLNTLGVQL